MGYGRSGPKEKFGDFGDDGREELERLSPDFALKTELSDHNPLYAELDESVDVGLRLGLMDRLQAGADGGVRRRIGSAATS
ncbi:hypothetical protein [Candidatus Manganitrophus noduliformans]|uniref:Uncharacterized protein n=1 Tax=Candidatus Manganitrophus noduliformans TaxID=2606439 RepID=A0A7X6DP65_9BACT|nr:hypothetical protein [Candidatus Manganitrophus noduliformans]NKE70784.1 hypothetical protein [Candidatus Manganitrophus noduliformans]